MLGDKVLYEFALNPPHMALTDRRGFVGQSLARGLSITGAPDSHPLAPSDLGISGLTLMVPQKRINFRDNLGGRVDRARGGGGFSIRMV